MIYQVEEYFMVLDRSEIDLSKRDLIKGRCDTFGYKCNFDSNSVTIEPFDSEEDASQFKDDLLEDFGV